MRGNFFHTFSDSGMPSPSKKQAMRRQHHRCWRSDEEVEPKSDLQHFDQRKSRLRTARRLRQGGNVGHKQLAILLDFDHTATENHSGGMIYDRETPMGHDNQEAFKRVVSDWMLAGHNVAIVTRGIDTRISIYFTTILNMLHVMNDFRPGYISIYAPDVQTFSRDDQDNLWWATRKVSFVASFIDAANVSPHRCHFRG